MFIHQDKKKRIDSKSFVIIQVVVCLKASGYIRENAGCKYIILLYDIE